MPSTKRVTVLGGLGQVGRALVNQSVRLGHDTTVGVRRPGAAAQVFAAHVADRINVRHVDSLDPAAVRDALRGADIAINAAGNSNQGELFLQISQAFIEQAEVELGDQARVWLMGGLAAMDVPNTDLTGDRLFVPPRFKLHRHNLDKLRRTRLSWSLACPGPMVERYKRPLDGPIRVSIEEMPFSMGENSNRLPRPILTAAFFRRIPQTRVSYDDVALAMLHGSTNPAFECKRVGFALPRTS